METTRKFLSLLAIYIIILVQCQCQCQGEEFKGKGKELINKVCETTATKDLCVKVLTSDPKSAEADIGGLAMISLKTASANASGILTDVKRMINDEDLDPAIQQGLADCKQTILDAGDQIEDAIASILEDAKLDAQKWLRAALAAIDACDDSIPGDDDILSRKSRSFRQLCNIAVAINNAFDDQDQDQDQA